MFKVNIQQTKVYKISILHA